MPHRCNRPSIVVFIFPLFIYGLDNGAQTLDKLLIVDRLQQIVLNMMLNGCLSIFEISMRREQQTFDMLPMRRYAAYELDTVHLRHTDVCNDNIDFIHVQYVQSFSS
ncbi:hypothetical protein D3C78_1076390 [compost metagenome]